MSIRLARIQGMLLAAEFRAGDPADPNDSGFINVAVLPEGSREVLELWAFGDSAAGHAAVKCFGPNGEGRGQAVQVGGDLRAKMNKQGTACNLSTNLYEFVGPDGEIANGRVGAPYADSQQG